MKVLAELLEKHSERKDYNGPGPEAQGQRSRSHYPPAVKHSPTLICQTDPADLRPTRRIPLRQSYLNDGADSTQLGQISVRPGLAKIACTLGQLFNLKHILSY